MKSRTIKDNEAMEAIPDYTGHVVLIGRVTSIPIHGKQNVLFSLKTKRSWRFREKWISITECHQVLATGHLAQFMQTLVAGDRVMLAGKVGCRYGNNIIRAKSIYQLPPIKERNNSTLRKEKP